VGALASIAAGDPRGDASPCRPSAPGGGDPPDLIAARGTIVEGGTSLRWVLDFARPLVIPDRAGKPFRVDVLIRDPSVPALDVAYYRDVNRIVRYDAVADPSMVVLSLPERAEDLFNAPTVEGRRLTIQVPGRMISQDLDLQGPSLGRLRWTVVVRDEHRCDLLGTARPHLRFDRAAGEATPSVISPHPRPASDGAPPWLPIAVGLVAIGAIVVAVTRRRRIRADGDPTDGHGSGSPQPGR
jgi:hypothetical protein